MAPEPKVVLEFSSTHKQRPIVIVLSESGPQSMTKHQRQGIFNKQVTRALAGDFERDRTRLASQ